MAKTSGGAPRRPEQDVMVLTELEQIKVLADPLRIRILEELGEERTTKQVAERLGEKPTKLYHHVDALERVGLIELTRTRPNRGTLEKYYLARARSFRADSRAFAGEDGSDDVDAERSASIASMTSTILDSTRDELTGLASSIRSHSDIERMGVISFLEVRARKEVQDELRERLEAIIAWLSSLDGEDDDDAERYRFTLAYFPLRGPRPDGDSD